MTTFRRVDRISDLLHVLTGFPGREGYFGQVFQSLSRNVAEPKLEAVLVPYLTQRLHKNSLLYCYYICYENISIFEHSCEGIRGIEPLPARSNCNARIIRLCWQSMRLPRKSIKFIVWDWSTQRAVNFKSLEAFLCSCDVVYGTRVAL